uniref:Uncharacterized protein n=1 Tax=Oryza brachyantha TaxID=4533 RepID=J3KUI9_ORYBR
MDTAAVHHGEEEEEEIGVFTAERYFSGGDVDALWCGRSSSSLSSAFKNGGQQEYWSAAPTTLTAATSSSEASWNSRSVLLRDRDPAVSASVGSGAPSGAGGDGGTLGAKPSSASASASPSHNLLLRWLLGMAACACAGGGVEEAVSADECRSDEARAAGVALGGGKRSAGEADAALPGRKSTQAAVDVIAATRMRPGPCDGHGSDAFDAGAAMPPPLVQLAEPRRSLRAADPGELSLSARLLNPGAASSVADEPRRRSADMFPLARHQNSAFTIVAGSTAARDGAGTGTAGGGDDAAWDGEMECVHPQSEASVVWSVVTADGAASAGNFSSAASGYYHHCYYYHNGGGGGRHTDAGKSNRRSRTGGLLTMGCISDRALDAGSPARAGHRRPPPTAEGAATWHAAGRQ